MEAKTDFTQGINTYFTSITGVLQQVDKDELNRAMNALLEAYENGADIYCFGNGGSAATASHMLNDFNKGISYGLEKKFRFICLNDNVAVLTALSNDVGYEFVYVKQIEGKMRKGDLVVAISGSGNSKNVILAAEYAKSRGGKVIGITGYDGGELWQLADYHMHVPSFDMQVVEDIHMVFNHMIMKLFCQMLSEVQ